MSNWELLLRHVAALKASVTQGQVGLELVQSQLKGLEAAIQAQATPDRAVIQIPDACLAYQEGDCARRCDDAVIEMGGMGGTDVTRMCRGCGETF